MKDKDNSKCKEWERRRRGKINDAFKSLCQLLPNYDPSKNLAKIDILERSTEFVKELRLSNSRLLSQQAETDEKCKLIKDLQDEVNKLILRVKQLTALLKDASISIPLGPSIKSLGKRKLKWSIKSIPENVENKSVSAVPNSIQGCNKGLQNSCNPADLTANNGSSLPTPLKETNGTAASLTSDKESIPAVETNLVPSDLLSVPLEVPKSNAVQIPLQTIFLTSCPVAPVVNQSSQVITRIALGPTRILPKPPDGILHKIAIRQIRKPLPPKEKKRRRRKKKVIVEKIDAETQSQAKFTELKTNEESRSEKIAPLVDKTREESAQIKEIVVQTEEVESVEVPIIAINSPIIGDDQTNSSNVNPAFDEKIINPKPSIPEVINEENLELVIENCAKPSEIRSLTPIETAMEVDITIAQEVEVMTQIEDDLNKIYSSELEPDISKVTTAEQSGQKLVEIEISSMQDSSKSPTEGSKESRYMDISDYPQPKTITAVRVESQKLPSPVAQVVEVSRNDNVLPPTCKTIESSKAAHTNSKPLNLDIEPLSMPNQSTSSSICDTVTGEKISECIARSIDLIDGPDGELMELAENWGENVHSPKSPISPTQMFLSMFPLLPREMIVAVSENSNQGQNKNPYIPHRSFLIDSMLPEDPSASINIEGNSSRNSVIEPLNPSRSISSVPPSSALQDSTAFRLTEISPVQPTPAKPTSSSSVINPGVTCIQRSKHQESRVTVVPIVPAHKPVELNLNSNQLSRDLNQFEFANFHPISDYADNIFRDASRTRATPDCRHVTGSSVRSMLGTNHSNLMQPDTTFQIQHNQRQAVGPMGDISQEFMNQVVRNQPVQAISNLRTHPNFSSQIPSNSLYQHTQTQPHTIPSSRQNNPAPLQDPHGTLSYSIDNNLKHSYKEPTSSQKQTTSTTLKPQLFRPPVGDFQPHPVYHNLQQTFSNSKAPTVVNNIKSIGSKSVSADVSKRQKANEIVQPTQLGILSQSYIPQVHKPNNASVSNLSHIPSQTQPQYQSIGIHMEKHTSQPQRNYIQPKPSTTEPSKNYQKSQFKDPNHNGPRSLPVCQPRRHHITAPAPTAIQNPIPEVSNLPIPNPHIQQQTVLIPLQNRRSESSSRNQIQAVSSFPDFSLSMNFNQSQSQPYEPYNVNYSIPENSLHPTPNPVPQPRKSSRPTPFYLQDVQTHCESFNFDTASSNALINQHIVDQPYQAPKTQYSNPSVHPLSSSTSSNSSTHYFPSSSQSQSTCQGAYTHESSFNLTPRSQQHHNIIADNPLLYNPNSNLNANQHQRIPPTKNKPASTTNTQSQHNSTNYANQAGGNHNSNNSSSATASRPVNWMTDTPYRTNKASASTSNNASTANPFSVSKLVGNSSTQSSSNVTNHNITGTGNNSSPNICTNRNTSYCAEALIRKNPTWSNLNFGSSSGNQQQQQQVSQPPPTACISYQGVQGPDSYLSFSGYPNNFPHHSNYTNPNPGSDSVNSAPPPPPSGNPNAFNQFDPVNSSSNQQHAHQQHQYHFSQPHGTHHQQSTHHHGTTSSVSNFNLSSIFPEMNDKRNTGSNNNNNPPSGSNNSSANGANNNCGYYSSTHDNVRK